jgi:hypothetical protein
MAVESRRASVRPGAVLPGRLSEDDTLLVIRAREEGSSLADGRARADRPVDYAQTWVSKYSSLLSRSASYAPVDRYFQPASQMISAMSALSPAFTALAA